MSTSEKGVRDLLPERPEGCGAENVPVPFFGRGDVVISIGADGRLYFSNQHGLTTVLKPGRSLEVLATNQLDGSFMASPAVDGKALFLRTKTHLYRIETAGAEGK